MLSVYTLLYRILEKKASPVRQGFLGKTENFSDGLLCKADPTEHSWRGVLRGHVPSKSLSADSEIPCAMFWRTEKVGEKSDSFSRAERTRPLRPVSHLLYPDFENIPVERFQRNFPLTQLADTARRVPTIHAKHLASCAQLEQPDGATVLKSFRFCTMLFVFALETVQKPPCFSTNTAFHLKLVHSPQFFLSARIFWKKHG